MSLLTDAVTSAQQRTYSLIEASDCSWLGTLQVHLPAEGAMLS